MQATQRNLYRRLFRVVELQAKDGTRSATTVSMREFIATQYRSGTGNLQLAEEYLKLRAGLKEYSVRRWEPLFLCCLSPASR